MKITIFNELTEKQRGILGDKHGFWGSGFDYYKYTHVFVNYHINHNRTN